MSDTELAVFCENEVWDKFDSPQLLVYEHVNLPKGISYFKQEFKKPFSAAWAIGYDSDRNPVSTAYRPNWPLRDWPIICIHSSSHCPQVSIVSPKIHSTFFSAVCTVTFIFWISLVQSEHSKFQLKCKKSKTNCSAMKASCAWARTSSYLRLFLNQGNIIHYNWYTF